MAEATTEEIDWRSIADELASLARAAMHGAGWHDLIRGEFQVPSLRTYDEAVAIEERDAR